MGLLKPRHERFCRHFVDCMNATVAAKAAGYMPASARNAGYRLLRQPRIVRRIIELQHETAATHCRDVNVLLGKLETIYRRAVDDRQLAAAARAVELQAKLSGVAPTGAPNRTSDTADPQKADAEVMGQFAGDPSVDEVLAALPSGWTFLQPNPGRNLDPNLGAGPDDDDSAPEVARG